MVDFIESNRCCACIERKDDSLPCQFGILNECYKSVSRHHSEFLLMFLQKTPAKRRISRTARTYIKHLTDNTLSF
ncbi:hypothetical protein J2T17_004622 [Paenibacillus mucilaginosus]